MKRTLIGAALITMFASDPAFAILDGCATVSATPDGYLSVRSGPGRGHPEIFRLPRGHKVSTDSKPDGANDKWWHVNGVVMPNGQDTALVDGWAYGRYLRPASCPE